MGHVQGHACSKLEIKLETRPLTLGCFLTQHTTSSNGHPVDLKIYCANLWEWFYFPPAGLEAPTSAEIALSPQALINSCHPAPWPLVLMCPLSSWKETVTFDALPPSGPNAVPTPRRCSGNLEFFPRSPSPSPAPCSPLSW